MKKGVICLAGILVLVILAVNVSAGVYFSQPAQTYNLGDIINTNIEISPLESGPIKVTLICEGVSNIVSYESLPKESFSFQLPLTNLHIQNLTGNCFFKADYSGKEYKSREFQISKKLDIKLDINSLFANPGERITISGTAYRLSGNGINGEVEITIPLLRLAGDVEDNENSDSDVSLTVNESEKSNETQIEEISEEDMLKEIVESVDADSGIFYGQVIEGDFSISFNLSKTLPAGDYRIDVLAYEEIDNVKTSEGVAVANLKVNQILTSVDVAVSGQNIDPGVDFNFRPRLIDQSGKVIKDQISVVLKNEKSERIYEKIVNSDESVNYNIPTNMSSGYYTITASSGEFSSSQKFYINEKPRISFELLNSTLTVKNIGNVRYKKDIEVELNGKPFIKSLDLDLGEVQEFRLSGEGDYNIKISDGETEILQKEVALTGRAVGVKEINQSASLSSLIGPMIWIIIIILLGAVILFIFKNVLKKKSFAYNISEKLRFRKKKDGVRDMSKIDKNFKSVVQTKPETKPVSGLQKTPGVLVPPSQAEQVLVLKGHRTRAAVIALKIKNKIGNLEKQSLEKAIEHVYQDRGAVYEQGDYIFIIFSPLMTRSYKNEVNAAKAAEKILLALKEHNKKFKNKIEFGIGINSGEIINKVEDKKLKFTALGNLTSVSKRLADSSDEQILVSKEAYQHGIAEIKAEKIKVGNGEIYELKRVIDHEKNQRFIQGFLERMDADKK